MLAVERVAGWPADMASDHIRRQPFIAYGLQIRDLCADIAGNEGKINYYGLAAKADQYGSWEIHRLAGYYYNGLQDVREGILSFFISCQGRIKTAFTGIHHDFCWKTGLQEYDFTAKWQQVRADEEPGLRTSFGLERTIDDLQKLFLAKEDKGRQVSGLRGQIDHFVRVCRQHNSSMIGATVNLDEGNLDHVLSELKGTGLLTGRADRYRMLTITWFNLFSDLPLRGGFSLLPAADRFKLLYMPHCY